MTVTPPRFKSRFQTFIAIETDGLGANQTCTTEVYVKLRRAAFWEIRRCQAVSIYDGSELSYTFPFNDGVQIFDADMNKLLDGPIDPIRLTPVGCP